MQKATNKVVDLYPQQELEPWEIEWKRCKPLLVKAMKYQDTYTIDDIEDKIRNGIAFLWPGKESAMVTELILFPQIKAMNILVFGGNFEEFKEMLEHIEKFAKEAGVQRLYGGGRKGWIRKTKPLGFKQEVLLSKDL
tara:strand:- start:4324 stop:4734 length:411 start_codon:yes stop_codon:yes gene_type:complete